MKILKAQLFILLLIFVASCSDKETNSVEIVNPIETINLPPTSDSTNIVIDLSDALPISPQIYGVNNDWVRVPRSEYTAFDIKLKEINYQLIRFPGGWESEFYDWSENTTPNFSKDTGIPGATINDIKGKNPTKISIVVPTAIAMNEPINSNAWNTNVQKCNAEAEDAINITGADNILSIEIGNEWWLQWGGGVSRANKLIKYANTAKLIAKNIRTKFPNAKFKVLVNGDFTNPQEFTTIRNIFSTDIDLIDGLTLHPYAGYNDPEGLYVLPNLVTSIKACVNNLGKSYISLSEWAPAKAYNDNQIYAEGANLMVEQIYEFARSGANEAAFWPPINTGIPGLGFFDTNFKIVYPTAQLFGDMALDFRGEVLKVIDGSMRGIASRSSKGNIILYVTGKTKPSTRVKVSFSNNQKIANVVYASLWEPGNLNNTKDAVPMKLNDNPLNKLSQDKKSVSFNVNSNAKYSIYKIELKLQ